jgi:hypothetical protein
MVVPRELLSSVASLGVETPDGFNANGIAYFVSVPATLVPGKVHVYLVTAGHCVRDRDNLVVRLNEPGGGTTIDLVPPGDRWLQLADPAAEEDYVDLAAVPWNPEASSEAGYTATPLAMIFDERLVGTVADVGVGVGDEVFAVGVLGVRYARDENAPLVRTGNVAMIPQEPVLVRYQSGPELRMRLYLTEFHSGRGLDGAPVFARPRAQQGGGEPNVMLLGTLIGPWDDEHAATELGLAKVLPAQLLKDLLSQEDELERRREAEQRGIEGEDGWLADATSP